MRCASVLAAVLLLAPAAPGLAVGDNPCRADMERLCGGVAPGGGRRVACLRGQLPKLSPECRTRLAQSQRSLRGVEPRLILGCKADIEALCKGVPQGNGRWRRCLEEHAAGLSAPCRELLDRAAP